MRISAASLLLLAGAAVAVPTPVVKDDASPVHRLEARATNVTVASPNAVTTINNYDGVGAGSNTYKSYSGDGSTGAGWPSKSQWASYNAMLDANTNNILNSCVWNGWKSKYGVAANNTSPQELTYLNNSIQAVAQSSGVDHRVILAVVMQESKGCVRVPTTSNSVYNPGLMQSYMGSGTCNDNLGYTNNNYAMFNPCPWQLIQQMIYDGTVGTYYGPGLVTDINQAAKDGATGAQVIYRASRYYNSGSICNNDLSNACGATGSYASDIANRLTGWVG